MRALASFALGLGKLVAAVLILGFAVLYPIQRDYYRGQDVRDAFVYGQRVAGFVSRYRAMEQRLPQRLSDLGLPFEQPEPVSSIQLDPASGSLRIRVANEPDGKETLELVAALNRDGELVHTCRSVNIPDSLMPRDCVHQQLSPT